MAAESSAPSGPPQAALDALVEHAVEPADARRHVRARGVVHADERQALLSRELEETRELAPVGRVHRAGAEREVVAVHRDVTPADREHARHDRRAVERLAPVLPEQVRLLVREHLQALEDRHAALRVLDANARRSTPALGPLEQLEPALDRLLVDRSRWVQRGDRLRRRDRGQRVLEQVFRSLSRHAGGPSRPAQSAAIRPSRSQGAGSSSRRFGGAGYQIVWPDPSDRV